MKKRSYNYNRYITQFEEAKTSALWLQSSVDSNLLVTRPSSHTWSAAECVAHLIEFGNIYFENINRKIEIAPSDKADPAQAFPPRLIWKGIIKLFEPPYKLKLKTIKSFKPKQAAHNDASEIFATFLELQDRFIDQLKRCRQKGIHLNNIKVSHPLLPFIKMTLSEAYAVAEAHQRRHLWQAEQVLTKLLQH